MFVKILSPIALIVFLTLIAILMLSDNGTTLVWTLIIPVVPLFIIVAGYHQWRDICPLAFFAKLTQYIQLASFKKHKISPWFETNMYLVQFSALLMAFTFRLYFLNNSNQLLGLFFILVIVLAFLSGLFFTGKTWCNFLCPVSLVERVYTLSSHKTKLNSACSSCSACKSNCPDLGMEASYWKEVQTHKKKIAIYSFPGLVFGFYAYYYLQTGSWDYYFSGDWLVSHLTLGQHLLSAGFFFFESIPLLIAAPLTLLLFSLFSFILFVWLEKVLHKIPMNTFEQALSSLPLDKKEKAETISHIVNVLIAFFAFNSFYIFAGAPSYSHYPVTYAIFHFMLIAFSSTILYKEIFRNPEYMRQETAARRIIKNWTGEKLPSKNLKQIYYTYESKRQDHEVHLEIYKETIEELFFNGILSKENIHTVQRFQKKFNISQGEHEHVVASLKRSCTDLSQDPLNLSSEKLYQLQHYQADLSRLITNNPKGLDKHIHKLQDKFNIEDEEHSYIFNKIINHDNQVHEQVNKLVNKIISYSCIAQPSSFENSTWFKYMYFVLDENRIYIMQELKVLLSLLFNKDEAKKILQTLHSNESYNRPLLQEYIEIKHPEIVKTFLHLFDLNQKNKDNFTKEELERTLKQLLCSSQSQIIACAIYVISQEFHDNISIFNLEKFLGHESSLVNEISLKTLNNTETMTQIEKEAYLQNVPLFSRIKSFDISKLASTMHEVRFKKGETLVSQNQEGDSLFVLVQGQAIVSILENTFEKEVSLINEGNYIGEISILSRLPRTATVRAKTSLITLELSGDSLRSFIIEFPLVSLQLMQEITKRLIELKS
ncbi:cyclic nucleotide-binding domain-containing protein [Sulfurimonas sp. MAG313]|nr:cyclic nucleotide-binding domain-containing protein [Sulfurimonas sp. MAG313]MDF1881956.1 cyclic nucleotide-binding domain-containing protein [Sulfurimonas sp. MAG313]